MSPLLMRTNPKRNSFTQCGENVCVSVTLRNRSRTGSHRGNSDRSAKCCPRMPPADRPPRTASSDSKSEKEEAARDILSFGPSSLS